METLLGKYYFYNHQLRPIHEFQRSALVSGKTIYEVLKICDRVPLFYEDHFERLHQSFVLAGKSLAFSSAQILEAVFQVIDSNNLVTGNVKLIFNPDEFSFSSYIIPHRYPTLQHLHNGVQVSLLNALRNNPNTKLLNASLRSLTNQLIEEKGVYEVLLLNNQNCITEGSRSNFFAILGDEIVTPPLEQVLPGITRKKVKEIAQLLSVTYVEKSLPLDVVLSCDALFLSGTSPGILAINKLENHTFQTENILLKKILDAYQQLIKSYIFTHKR